MSAGSPASCAPRWRARCAAASRAALQVDLDAAEELLHEGVEPVARGVLHPRERGLPCSEARARVVRRGEEGDRAAREGGLFTTAHQDDGVEALRERVHALARGLVALGSGAIDEEGTLQEQGLSLQPAEEVLAALGRPTTIRS